MIYPVPRKLERLVDEVDGWLELRCPERALPLVDALLAEPSARACGLSLRIRAYARMAAFEKSPRKNEMKLSTRETLSRISISRLFPRTRAGSGASAPENVTKPQRAGSESIQSTEPEFDSVPQ